MCQCAGRKRVSEIMFARHFDSLNGKKGAAVKTERANTSHFSYTETVFQRILCLITYCANS